MQPLKLLLAHTDIQLRNLLVKSILTPAGYEVTYLTDLTAAGEYVKNNLPDLVILGESLKDGSGLDLASSISNSNPNIPIILMTAQLTPTLLQDAIRSGICDCLVLPIRSKDIQVALERALDRRKTLEGWAHTLARRFNRSLHLETGTLESPQSAWRAAVESRDVDNVLTSIIDTAVHSTGADGGCFLLLDESRGEFFIQTACNYPEDYLCSFHLPIFDTIAGQALRTGEPVVLTEQIPPITHAPYQVQACVYLPLISDQGVIGVMAVDKKNMWQRFTDDDLALLHTLAGYAAFTIGSARRFSYREIERHKLETIMTQFEDGLLVLGTDHRIILINQSAREILGLKDHYYEGRLVSEVIHHPDLLDIIDDHRAMVTRTELNLEDGRVFNAQLSPIPEVGVTIIMQDITHLKEIDRIKTDFVNTVSHDLRSPLTAILGYAELIERAGPTTEQQKDFIRRVQFSVHNITALINDLLDLGRIEAGFDTRKELVYLPAIIQYAIEGLRNQFTKKNQTIEVEVPNDLPDVLGNPSHLRQMISNLINNCIKFTQMDGQIMVSARAEAGQIILQLTDNGPGIPPTDQPFIFDKFYRGSNVPSDALGTGLGLAIVKSIVDNHQGRIWINSEVGEGTTFTIVLPIAQ